jgi:hypothetical protein
VQQKSAKGSKPETLKLEIAFSPLLEHIKTSNQNMRVDLADGKQLSIVDSNLFRKA